MSTFTLNLHGATRAETIEGVESFVGRDRSGQFGIRAHHERLMTVLDFGLAQFRRAGEPWCYLGLPGGLLYFAANELCICTSRFLRDDQRERLAQALEEELRAERAAQWEFHQSIRQLEEELLHRLSRMPHDATL